MGKPTGSRITGFLPEFPLLGGGVASLLSGIYSGHWDPTVAWNVMPWCIGTWAVARIAIAVRRHQALYQWVMQLTAPVRIVISYRTQWVLDRCFRRMDWGELLDYLSGGQFDPVVMCAPYGKGWRIKRDLARKVPECERCFCRFGRAAPVGVDKDKVPGNKMPTMVIWDRASGKTATGSVESWSARDIALRLAGSPEQLSRRAQLVLETRSFGVRQGTIDVVIASSGASNASDLVVARSRWEPEQYLRYKTHAPPIPCHQTNGRPIDKKDPWWSKAVREQMQRAFPLA